MKAGSFLSLTFIFMVIMAPVAFASSITNYTYDPNGNMLSDGEFNYTYNAANQMVMAIEADTGDFVEEYLYDHSGNRVKKIESTDSGNKTTYYVSSLYEITVEPDGSTTNTTYIYANGERVARNETNENGSTVFYYHSDHLDSTSVVTTNGNLMTNLTEADSTWTTIQLNKSLSRPVIIAKITSENDTDNAEIRLSNASSDSFVLMIEETGVFDGSHANETISYMALEEGIIANGADTIGEAGTIEAGFIWTRVTFQERFDTVPVVVASPMTINSDDAGTIRTKNIGTTGFDVRFEEYTGGDHPLETIGWIAVKQGTHTLDDKTIVAGSTSVNSNYSSVSLSGFSSTPAVITQIQSHSESDYGSHTRVTNASNTSFEIKIEENNDTAHATETIGYIAIEPTVIKSGSAKVGETKYYPYGVIQEGGSERYLYTGKEKDAGTGLYYYEARYYNPSVGRFIQADTFIPDVYNPQALNRYSYVLNNPMRYTDPSGHAIQIPAAILAVAGSITVVGALAVIDKAITAHTLYESYKVFKDPASTEEQRGEAKFNAGVALALEVIDPFQFLPVDDIFSIAIIKRKEIRDLSKDELLEIIGKKGARKYTIDWFIGTGKNFLDLLGDYSKIDWESLGYDADGPTITPVIEGDNLDSSYSKGTSGYYGGDIGARRHYVDYTQRVNSEGELATYFITNQGSCYNEANQWAPPNWVDNGYDPATGTWS